jgi:hypothetical protein
VVKAESKDLFGGIGLYFKVYLMIKSSKNKDIGRNMTIKCTIAIIAVSITIK